MGFVQESNGNMLGVGPRADRYAGAQAAGVVPKPTVEDAVKGAVGRYKGVYEPYFKPKPTASERMIQGMSKAGEVPLVPKLTASERMIQGMSKAGMDADWLGWYWCPLP